MCARGYLYLTQNTHTHKIRQGSMAKPRVRTQEIKSFSSLQRWSVLRATEGAVFAVFSSPLHLRAGMHASLPETRNLYTYACVWQENVSQVRPKKCVARATCDALRKQSPLFFSSTRLPRKSIKEAYALRVRPGGRTWSHAEPCCDRSNRQTSSLQSGTAAAALARSAAAGRESRV